MHLQLIDIAILRLTGSLENLWREPNN